MMANNLLDIKMETNIKSIWQGNTQEKGTQEGNIKVPDLYFLDILIRYRIQQCVVFQIKHLVCAAFR